jgi:hypothetical protein
MALRLGLCAAATLMLLAGAGHAQDHQLQSSCTPVPGSINGSVNCTTTERPAKPVDDDRCALTKPYDILLSGCRKYEVESANARVALKKHVGELLASGQCDEAVKTALTAGNFELATQAKTFCAAGAPK